MRNRLEAEAWAFHQENPRFMEKLEEFTFEVIRAGFKNYSINSVFERLRWHFTITTKSDDGFKLNNNHRPYYARWFMEKYPEYDGFFRTRKIADETGTH